MLATFGDTLDAFSGTLSTNSCPICAYNASIKHNITRLTGNITPKQRSNE